MRPSKYRRQLVRQLYELAVNFGVLLERDHHCIRQPIYDDIGYVRDEMEKVVKKLYKALQRRSK